MSSGGPTRQSDSLADVVEMLLDKGVVINADIVVSIGDTELLGVQLRAAIASFETAAEYGLEFPDGTDMRRVEEASGRSALPDEEDTVQSAIVEAGEAVGESDDEDDSEPGIRARPTGVGGDEADDERPSEGSDDDD
ncbi:gas vesicle protein GvpJ [Halococcus sp. AFM35]|uniref:gas vesicle protein GvpJ n=1 Tax=Halococcus sp. AFM35 TaxID=3421653 RepID=UPI003EBC2C0A